MTFITVTTVTRPSSSVPYNDPNFALTIAEIDAARVTAPGFVIQTTVADPDNLSFSVVYVWHDLASLNAFKAANAALIASYMVVKIPYDVAHGITSSVQTLTV